MQSTQEVAMQDTCIVQAYSRTIDSFGAPVETWTDGDPIVCGFDPTPSEENRRADMTALHYDATVRLPIDTSIDTRDRIKVTKRFAVTLSPAETFSVLAVPQRGPSGLVLLLERITV
jgi:head-tail adaptor